MIDFKLLPYIRGKHTEKNIVYFRCNKLYGVNKASITRVLKSLFPQLELEKIRTFRNAEKLLVCAIFKAGQKYPWLKDA